MPRNTGLQRREVDARQREFIRQDMIKLLHKETVLKNVFEMEHKVDDKRTRLEIRKQLEEEKRSREQEDVFILLFSGPFNLSLKKESQKMARALLNRIEEEEAKKLEEKKLDDLRKSKHLQVIRENSDVLKNLEKKLMEAYMNKERSVQIQEKILSVKQQQVALEFILLLVNSLL